MQKGLIILVVALHFLSSGALAQNKSIVVLGSSTAAGTGAFPYDSSWAGRLQLHYRQNTTGVDETRERLLIWHKPHEQRKRIVNL